MVRRNKYQFELQHPKDLPSNIPTDSYVTLVFDWGGVGGRWVDI